MALLSRFSRLQRITLYLIVAFITNIVLARTIGNVPAFIILDLIIFFVLLVLVPAAVLGPVLRRVTWRVRNRLMLTYFLVGVIPIVLIFFFLQFGTYLLVGQTTSYLMQKELDRRIAQVYFSAEHLLAEAGDEVVPAPAWSKPGYKGIVRDASAKYFLAAHAKAGDADVFVRRPLTETMLADLLPGTASAQVIDDAAVSFRIGTSAPNPNAKVVLDSEHVKEAPASKGWWDADIESASPVKVESMSDGKAMPAALVTYSHPSGIVALMFSTWGQAGVVLGLFMAFLAFLFLIVEVGAVVASIRISRTLTSAVHDLHTGTRTIESGDFSHRIPVRQKDQLGELASSFNAMTERLEKLIVEVKEKEKLESELEIARQVQAQLFPKEVPTLATLELAGVCNPARVVSGDYYDFIPIASRGAAVVVGDISGKGISAALLMASVQSSLHAQLAMDTVDTEVSTATLVTRLNRQLYASTPAEKYATFYCAVYDDRNSRLSYTNAGHLAPVLIRNGEALRLESNGTIVGMFPEYPFEQTTIGLQKGDLLAAFTDGITESENAQEEQFGEDRLIELLKANSARPLNDIIQLVMQTITQWAHDPSARDDITMLLARKL